MQTFHKKFMYRCVHMQITVVSHLNHVVPTSQKHLQCKTNYGNFHNKDRLILTSCFYAFPYNSGINNKNEEDDNLHAA